METSGQNGRVRPWLYFLLLAGIACLFGFEVRRSNRVNELRAENSTLRGQVTDLEAVHARNTQLEEIRQELLRALDSQSPEILALREEVARLRPHTNQVASLRMKFVQAKMNEERLKERILMLQSELAAKPAVPRFGAWVGVSIRDAQAGREGSAPPTGAEIIQIVSRSPADQADLQVRDRVLAVDGEAIAGAEDLKRILSQKTGGQMVAFDVARQNAILRIAVQPHDWPH